MTKCYIQITGMVDSEGKTIEELKEDLRRKAEKHFRFKNLQVMIRLRSTFGSRIFRS